jgi:hypothetical protein
MQGAGTRPPAGRISPDGMWRWDGTAWQPVASPETPPPSAASSPRSWLATGGGIAGLIGVPFVLAGCIFPFVYYSDTSQGGPASASIFNLGYPGGLFYAFEPVVVMLFAAAAAVFLIAWQIRPVRAVGAGALLAFGVQTTALFIGYIGSELAYGRIGASGPLGTIDGVALVVGGALAASSLLVGNRHSA